jgi:hypothetical protein
MTKDDIIRMAREAGLQPYYDEQESDITAFAKLVAKHEREACAKLCDDKAKETIIYHGQVWSDYFARAIRTRGNT